MSIGDCRLPSVHKLQSGLMRPQNDGPKNYSKIFASLNLEIRKNKGSWLGVFSSHSMQHKVGITRNSRLAIDGGWRVMTVHKKTVSVFAFPNRFSSTEREGQEVKYVRNGIRLLPESFFTWGDAQIQSPA